MKSKPLAAALISLAWEIHDDRSRSITVRGSLPVAGYGLLVMPLPAGADHGPLSHPVLPGFDTGRRFTFSRFHAESSFCKCMPVRGVAL